MTYDFTTFLDRKGHDALAYDALGLEGFPLPPIHHYAISMWVADMNFVACPTIIEGIKERLAHPSFGYFLTPSAYYQHIAWWHLKQFGVKGLKQEHIVYANSVLGALVTTLRTFLVKGDNVLTHEPTYIGFIHAIKDVGFNLVTSSIVEKSGKYEMDYADLEQKMIDYDIKVFLLCNPHNPLGINWSKEDLLKLDALCKKHNVLIVSDEIWADLVLSDEGHLPMYQVNADARMRSICLYGLTKTFNLASITGAYMVIYNETLRKLIQAELDATCLNNPHLLSVYALMSAYTESGLLWVSELKEVLKTNVELMSTYLQGIEGIKFIKPAATYMLYLDCSEYCRKNQITFDELLKHGWEEGVIWQDGRPFGWHESIRINVASPTHIIEEAIHWMKDYLFKVSNV